MIFLNLDGSDGMQYYRHDLRKEKEIFFRRQNGGGGVMVWGGFSAAGKTSLALLTGRQNSINYQERLRMHFPLLPIASLSPDLNPIENLWGDIVRIIYAGGKQYEDLPELRVAILRAWDEILVTRLLKLVSTMNDRCMDVLVNKGDKVGY